MESCSALVRESWMEIPVDSAYYMAIRSEWTSCFCGLRGQHVCARSGRTEAISALATQFLPSFLV